MLFTPQIKQPGFEGDLKWPASWGAGEMCDPHPGGLVGGVAVAVRGKQKSRTSHFNSRVAKQCLRGSAHLPGFMDSCVRVCACLCVWCLESSTLRRLAPGNCTFIEKCLNAQMGGANAMLVTNHKEGKAPHTHSNMPRHPIQPSTLHFQTKALHRPKSSAFISRPPSFCVLFRTSTSLTSASGPRIPYQHGRLGGHRRERLLDSFSHDITRGSLSDSG